MEQQSLIVASLIAVAVAGLMYALVYPHLSGDIKAQRRTAALVSSTERKRESRAADPAKRRKLIAESLKDIEEQTSKRVTLEQRIAQAGLAVSRQSFIIGAVAFALLTALVLYVVNGNALIALGGGIVAAFGLPNWTLGFLRKRRIAKFIDEFPNAVDIIIRGVQAGFSVADCFRLIAAEAPEPVRGEFRRIVESQTIGLSVGEATERLAERVPVAETSFFSIVISLQQKSGGNLSETLGNLSQVLRDRKKMKAKIKSMSAEAKASAGIIGSLPFLVGGAVSLTTPTYMALLFTTNAGKLVVAVGLIWMAIGVFVMKKMINFDI